MTCVVGYPALCVQGPFVDIVIHGHVSGMWRATGIVVEAAASESSLGQTGAMVANAVATGGDADEELSVLATELMEGGRGGDTGRLAAA